ncbi:uncharacterized protein LOC115876506 [Sitophilus oryzae]|uniref:Uncharacterized protein LOC115876506 n=1 Tax=Sitophilus oryzae TaxID=7048 RepID=A0A6J2XA82_SITOR|nr:uncharacterized protein LOC115876506 [Sitophilus oryzae]
MLHKLIFALVLPTIGCIWPPQYKIELKHEEEFVISELLQKSDVEDIYDEEEMMKEEDLKTFNLHENAGKYFRLHKQTKKINEKGTKDVKRNVELEQKKIQSFPEFNPVEGEEMPWIGGMVGEDKEIINDDQMVYFDDEAKSNQTNSLKHPKRSSENDTASDDYNYDSLKAEYEDNVRKAENKKDTAKYKEVKEEESPKEAAESLVEFQPRNCTEEEKKGFGFATVKCFWREARHRSLNKDKKTYIMKKLLMIAMVWLIVYVIIAVPLWCQYGWCCCCCRCKFCQPRDQIEEIKTFFENNPPGTYHDEKGNLVKYKQTNYEVYAQKNLEKAILKL